QSRNRRLVFWERSVPEGSREEPRRYISAPQPDDEAPLIAQLTKELGPISDAPPANSKPDSAAAARFIEINLDQGLQKEILRRADPKEGIGFKSNNIPLIDSESLYEEIAKGNVEDLDFVKDSEIGTILLTYGLPILLIVGIYFLIMRQMG